MKVGLNQPDSAMLAGLEPKATKSASGRRLDLAGGNFMPQELLRTCGAVVIVLSNNDGNGDGGGHSGGEGGGSEGAQTEGAVAGVPRGVGALASNACVSQRWAKRDTGLCVGRRRLGRPCSDEGEAFAAEQPIHAAARDGDGELAGLIGHAACDFLSADEDADVCFGNRAAFVVNDLSGEDVAGMEHDILRAKRGVVGDRSRFGGSAVCGECGGTPRGNNQGDRCDESGPGFPSESLSHGRILSESLDVGRGRFGFGNDC